MTKEQAENDQRPAEGVPSDMDDAADKRERSTIQFPYSDLEDASRIPKAVHANADMQCALDQLAAYVKQPITSGTFRVRLSSAAIFGLTENERGTVRLTDLGRRICDPSQEADAAAEAFLRVPLYARIYENYKGFTLPPPAALERFMREAGVSPKQTDKARQAFARSAKQAGFFAHGEDRLVRPAQSGPGTKPIDRSDEETPSRKHGSNGGGGGGEIDPLIAALIQKLPQRGEKWPAPERVMWLQMMSMAFQMAYGAVSQIQIAGAGERPNEPAPSSASS